MEENSKYQGPYKVWHIPQVPMKAFEVYADHLSTAKHILDALAEYDLFQLEMNIKPEYANAGGIMQWDDDKGEYVELEDDDIDWLILQTEQVE